MAFFNSLIQLYDSAKMEQITFVAKTECIRHDTEVVMKKMRNVICKVWVF